jgi:branched-subunit amino acid aminotransferase/4-amino-4-deoxychorismate lyase
MKYSYFSRNGVILSVEQATIPISNIEYAYGFGVYETIRVNKGVIYFPEEHIQRLIESARIISLSHPFSKKAIERYLLELAEKINGSTYNLKLLLIGGAANEEASLYIECLSPFFPDKKLYRNGALCITYEYERTLPHAKSLNMLQSYLAYREARESDAYDALLVNRRGCITEGTRTNFFCLEGKTIITPNDNDILLGVMRKVALKVATENGFTILRKDIKLRELENYESAFVTSTSSKIMPIRSIDSHIFGEPTPALQFLMEKTKQFLDESNGQLSSRPVLIR